MPRKRESWKWPLSGERVARGPGDGLLANLLEVSVWGFVWTVPATFLVGIVLGYTVAGFIGIRLWLQVGLLVITIVAGVAASWRATRHWVRCKNDFLGLAGERVVAAILAELGKDGYIVIHDIVCTSPRSGGAQFNIDHILIGPAGVFCIETKTRSKRGNGQRVTFDGARLLVGGYPSDRDPLAQARAAVAHMKEVVRPVAPDAPLIPVVLFPKWFVEGPMPADVIVTNPKMIFSALRGRPSILDPQTVGAIYRAIQPIAQPTAEEPV